MLHSAASEPISLFVKADQNVYKTSNMVIKSFILAIRARAISMIFQTRFKKIQTTTCMR